jgi:hypothetical protein
MESLNDFLTRWQPFFGAVAGVAATFAGLLFVSLSINRERITAQQNRILLRVARRTFGDLMFTLFISLVFLLPTHDSTTLGVPLFILATCRCWLLARSFYRSAREIPQKTTGFGGVREYVSQIISLLGLVAATIEIYRGKLLFAYLLVPVIAFLLLNASMNAWSLLLMEKSADENSTKES